MEKLKPNKNKNENILTYGIFSVLFLTVALIIFGYFFFRLDRTLVWTYDGLSQHCLALAYYGEYLRKILHTVFVEHSLNIPMFDFSIGFGADIVSTLHYYVIGDPINLLSVFVSPEKTESLYSFIIILRMYLMGVTFCAFMNNKNLSRSSIITGALAYSFSGYCLLAGVRHPFFLTAMVWCPLVLLGIDNVFKGKSPALYIISLGLAVASNFYGAYMICIFMVIYAAIQYFTLYFNKSVKGFFAVIGKFFLFTVNGFLIPMVVFLPQIYNTLSTDRLNADNAVHLFYPHSYYESLLSYTTDANAMNMWLIMGFTGITVLCVLSAFAKAKDNKTVVISSVIGCIFLLFPFFGHALNGFTYVTNRWSWVLALIASSAVSLMYDRLFEMNVREKRLLAAFASAYMLLAIVINKAHNTISMMMMAVMMLGLAVVLGYQSLNVNKKIGKALLSVLLIISIFCQAHRVFSLYDGNYVEQFVIKDRVYEYMAENTSSKLIKDSTSNDEFFRYDNYFIPSCNDSLLNDVNSTSFFFSISNEYVSEFLNEMALNISFEQQYNNMDDRFILQNITGSKYITKKDSGNLKFLYRDLTDIKKEIKNYPAYYKDKNTLGSISASSNKKVNETTSIFLFETPYYMPMGYTYDSILPRDEYEKLSPAEKQSCIMKTAVTDALTNVKESKLNLSVKNVDLLKSIKTKGDITVEDGCITVNDPSAVLYFDLPLQNDSELYLTVQGLRFEEISPYDKVIEDLKELPSDSENGDNEKNPYKKIDKAGAEILKSRVNRYTYEETVSMSFAMKEMHSSKNISYYTPDNQFYSGRSDFAVNMGYIPPVDMYDKASDTVTVSFSNTGKYYFDSISYSYQDMNEVVEDTFNRRLEIMDNVKIDDNFVSGDINLSSEKILATQIPYSKGWTATVDGEEAEIINVNTMFCGLDLSQGQHHIEFKYKTPYADLALILSAAGTAGVIFISILDSKLKKRKTDKKSPENQD